MNKFMKLLPLTLLGVASLAGCNAKNTIYIYTAHEDNRIQLFNRELKQKFPDYDIQVVGMSTGKLMAEFEARGTKSQCDIFVGIEIGNAEILLNKNSDLFADLSDYDTSNYIDSVLEYQKDITLSDGTVRKGHKKYHIQDKEAGCVMYSKSKLDEYGLSVPTSYAELLTYPAKSVVMPDPKISGTGWYFVNGYASEHTKEEALTYFTSLKNSSLNKFSGSSEVTQMVDAKQVAVGLGMHFQAVEYANKNSDIGITYFNEGSPYTLYTMGMINGKEKNEQVKEVYDYFYSHVNYLDNSEIVPETIYKNPISPAVSNWDVPPKYSSMKNLLDPNYKSTFLDSWKLS